MGDAVSFATTEPGPNASGFDGFPFPIKYRDGSGNTPNVWDGSPTLQYPSDFEGNEGWIPMPAGGFYPASRSGVGQSVGPGTNYPFGFTLAQLGELYWRFKKMTVAALGCQNISISANAASADSTETTVSGDDPPVTTTLSGTFSAEASVASLSSDDWEFATLERSGTRELHLSPAFNPIPEGSGSLAAHQEQAGTYTGDAMYHGYIGASTSADASLWLQAAGFDLSDTWKVDGVDGLYYPRFFLWGGIRVAAASGCYGHMLYDDGKPEDYVYEETGGTSSALSNWFVVGGPLGMWPYGMFPWAEVGPDGIAFRVWGDTKQLPVKVVLSSGTVESYVLVRTDTDPGAAENSNAGTNPPGCGDPDSFSLPTVVLEADGYWPHKNAAGGPVFNGTTGEQINPVS